ncbi:cytidine deaminase [Candidatus Mycoplasma mahonii]|uniref:cytidine deaminase n=1 Tax=Candidatus Mycoplasma mahonii TaxID=3004105 RepID=UPI0026E95318|nr:cytidine deaminase [Candidatus Mycoplasma mahonii]WKX02788.1 cytidine deaminase [Candidatus Mycoplasma mahonii]
MKKTMDSRLNELLKNAYSPYSDVKVAAILEIDGQEFHGVNVENSSFGATICAERSALVSAISAGIKPMDITDIHVTSSLDKPLFPCGLCLQVMAETMQPNAKIHIYFNGNDETKLLKELLPYTITKESFGWK